MPLNDPTTPRPASELNAWYRLNSATAVLQHALAGPEAGNHALVSSFGAESVVLLHMVSVIRRSTPVIFLDTQMLFTETLVYQQELAERLGLSNLRIIQPDPADLRRDDPRNELHKSNSDACCALRKTVPLARALEGFDGWITGRKRFQGGTRETLDFFEEDAASGLLKINPLAHWTRDDVRTYMEENRLPRHPLVAKGYASIGCQPCTTPVKDGEDPRAGRWRGADKAECGIHFVNGKAVRTGEQA